jgi:hypothetical protein
LNNNPSVDELALTIIKIVNEGKPQTVKQLVTLVEEKLSLSEEKILDAILELQSQGKIRLNNPSQPASPKAETYMRTGKALWYWVTIAIAALTVVTVFTIPEDTYPLSYLRNALGIIFVLWLPGYTCVKALFPVAVPVKTSSENMDSIERAALSLGMSLALTPIVGLILNYTPFGIRLAPITLSLLALTVVFATAGVLREFKAKVSALP